MVPDSGDERDFSITGYTMPFQSQLAISFEGDDVELPPIHPVACAKQAVPIVERKVIQLRDYQSAATAAALVDIEFGRSSLIVLATGLGKTILFCKLVEQWKGRVLILAHLEELLQNARDDLRAITGEAVGTERGREHHEGERVVVGLVQSVSKRLKHFRPEHFSLIIVDEAHHAASDAYLRIFEHFRSAKVLGLTATDTRADGKALPFEACAYRMGIREGGNEGYLVPIRGRRVVLEGINLSRVKRVNDGEGDFDDSALDDLMVEGSAAVADYLTKTEDLAGLKGILFFPGRQSARLTCEMLNEREPGSALYLDGEIIGNERRVLVNELKAGKYRWLCNVGIATEGFNWPEASVVGMCSPTLSKPAYVQRVGRGTRPLAGLLNGLLTAAERKAAIHSSQKPFMLILDFVGASANLDLISHENFLDEKPAQTPSDEEQQREGKSLEEMFEEEEEEVEVNRSDLNLRAIATGIKSVSTHVTEDFDPFEATGATELPSLNLKGSDIGKEPSISHKQLSRLRRYGIGDETLTRAEAQKLIGYIAGEGWTLRANQLGILKKLHQEIKDAREIGF